MTNLCFKNVWNSREARFEACFHPVIATIPALVAALIVLGQLLAMLISRRPRWTRPFIEEVVNASPELIKWRTNTHRFVPLLVVGSVASGCLQVLSSSKSWLDLRTSAPAMAFLAISGLLCIQRPEKAPLSVLAIFILQDAAQITLFFDDNGHRTTKQSNFEITAIVITSIGVLLVLQMPFRSTNKPLYGISTPMSRPTSDLRSPEDNLTPWQFMTVSWMSPLLSLGSKRQIEGEDVWLLPYEFQHRRLHDKFRSLKGTVIRRLIKANILDIIIMTVLEILEVTMEFSGPVLLQYLLKSMETPTAPKRAAMVYAALSMTARLIAAQSEVFSLWYGRRCYERSRGEMITMLYEKTLNRKAVFVTTQGASEEKEAASTGKILNLMRNDVYEVAQRFWEVQTLIKTPLSAIFSITLVVRLLGWPSLLVLAAHFIAQGLIAILARIRLHYEKRRRAATDDRLQNVSQFIEAIRHLRWYGWQNAWLSSVMSARQKELGLRIITESWNVAIGFVNSLALDLTPVIAFFAYTVIAGKELRVDIAFPAIQIFQLLTQALRGLPDMITVLLNAYVAVSRIETFMNEPDKGDDIIRGSGKREQLALENASFAWPGSSTPVLREVTLTFPQQLTVMYGEVGSGKSALLKALLGELDLLGGNLIRPQEPVGYCAQTPWLQSMSIRDNILFFEPYSEERYKAVVEACALGPDLSEFKAGDLSQIGENGIGLSGGQRARVALARAVYSNAKILLLDDPLSALDQKTAEHVVRQCITGPLLRDRTVILVTHRVDLPFPASTQKIKLLGDGYCAITDEVKFQKRTDETLSATQSQRETQSEQAAEESQDQEPDKFLEDEHRAKGAVKASVYWEFIKAGKLRWWFVLVLVLVIYRLSSLAEAWFLKTWGEAYHEIPNLSGFEQRWTITTLRPTFLDRLPPPNVNIRPWLIGFLILAIYQTVSYIFFRVTMVVIVYITGKSMFAAIVERVAGATFRFYDVTPVGRLMNRMTSDIGVVDGNISVQLQTVVWLSISWISSMIVIGSITPLFLGFALLLTGIFVMIFMRFIPTSQSLRRLEMVSLTPLMSNFGNLLHGLDTVRAFCVQHQFQEEIIRVVDTFQKMDHFYWSTQAWLMYRYDVLSAISTFSITVLALATNVSAGLAAFVLLYADKLVNATHAMCKQYGQLQMEFVSVERVIELFHLEQEPKGGVTPPAWWPSFSGDIVFQDVNIRYAQQLDPALAGISFTVKGGSKTASLGRTGSGKSTLALALLAAVVPDIGQILIDNVDLAEVDKQLLRSRITFLAQDPVLFPGSMRKNLDPLIQHSDEECEQILKRVCTYQGWDLQTVVEVGGRNLSQGQRQLVSLARAVLRRSAIVILDEATASIDRDTAEQIQEVMSEEMKQSTVITIAHRLEAVRNADYRIVLGHGRIIEQGPV